MTRLECGGLDETVEANSDTLRLGKEFVLDRLRCIYKYNISGRDVLALYIVQYTCMYKL